MNSNGHDKEPVLSYPAGNYHVLQLKATDPFTRKLIPAAVERALEFIDRHNAETDKIWLANLVYANFAQNTNYIHFLVGIDQNAKIVAHCLSYVNTYGTLGHVADILQLEKDPADGHEILEVGMKLIDEWAASLGIKVVMNTSMGRGLARLYNRFGFQEYRVIMKKELPVEEMQHLQVVAHG